MCQISPAGQASPSGQQAEILKFLRCLVDGDEARAVSVLSGRIAAAGDETNLSATIRKLWSSWKLKNEHVIVSLPRRYVTLRTIKIPAALPAEIEKIVSLQASKYLPYPPQELISGYQILSSDKEGYSTVSLVIVHRDSVARYVCLFERCSVSSLKIAVSSYGLCFLHDAVFPAQEDPVMIVDIDAAEAEIVVACGASLLASRSFKINRADPSWQDMIFEQVRKTRDVYREETGGKEPVRLLITGILSSAQSCAQAMRGRITIPVEVLDYRQKPVIASPGVRNNLSPEVSLASLAGVSLRPLPQSLDLVPPAMREKSRSFALMKDQAVTTGIFLGSLIIACGGSIRHSDNKARYLDKLMSELRVVESDARPLEDLRKKFSYLQGRMNSSASSLPALRELHRIMPADISLTSLNFEERRQIVMRGQSPALESIFVFVSALENSPVLGGYNIKMRNATKRSVPGAAEGAQAVEFEIVCAGK